MGGNDLLEGTQLALASAKSLPQDFISEPVDGTWATYV